MTKSKIWNILIFIIITSAILFRLKNINAPLLDAHYFRQSQTATVARNFFLDGIDLLHPRIDIFGIEGGQVLVLEFPFYQALVAVISYIIGYSDSIGRLVSIFFGISGGITLMLFVNRLFKDKKIALISLVFFLFTPLNIYFQQAFMIESTVVALHIFSLYAWLNYCENKSTKWYYLSVVITTLAFLQKSVYAPFLLLPIITIWYLKKGIKAKNILGLLIGIFVLVVWQIYVDHTNTINGNSYFTSRNSGFRLWHFGLLSDRFSLEIWQQRILAILGNLTKLYILPLLAGLFYLIRNHRKDNLVLISWLLSMTAYYLIFFRIQSHEYYFMIIIPIISIIAALGLNYIAGLLIHILYLKEKATLLVYPFITIYLLSFCIKGYQNSKPYFSLDLNTKKDIEIMNNAMTEKGHVIFVFSETDWNSVYTYYLKRKGIVLDKNNLNNKIIKKYKNQGYRYIVFYGIQDLDKVKANKIFDENNIRIFEI